VTKRRVALWIDTVAPPMFDVGNGGASICHPAGRSRVREVIGPVAWLTLTVKNPE
jgi:hypothetical protein